MVRFGETSFLMVTVVNTWEQRWSQLQKKMLTVRNSNHLHVKSVTTAYVVLGDLMKLW